MGPIDVQRRIARQKGARLARRARSHGGLSAIDQSLDAGFKPCFSKINDSVTTETSVRALLLLSARPLCEEGFAQPKIGLLRRCSSCRDHRRRQWHRPGRCCQSRQTRREGARARVHNELLHPDSYHSVLRLTRRLNSRPSAGEA
jgi:hypothetical protein